MEKEYYQIEGETKKNRRVATTLWIFGVVAFLIISSILLLQLLYDNGAISSNKFYENTRINGVDVSGMHKGYAADVIASKLLSEKDEISIKLTYKDEEWVLTGTDFENNSDVFPIVEQAFEKGRSGPIAERISTVREIKSKGYTTNVSYRAILGGFDEKIDSIISDIKKDPVDPSIIFKPNETEDKMFEIKEGVNGIEVDKNLLYTQIDDAFSVSKNVVIDIPTNEIPFNGNGEELLFNTKLRSSFSTNYSSSQSGRKTNVKRALAEFNGMVVKPGEQVSFNDVTGDKTPEKGYEKAKIILNGVYVEGYGGGACQSSTTLYNALILADIQIDEVHPHSLPVSYVSLAFDAMVSEGYSDLKFTNNLDYPIYIKAWGDGENAYVKVYGKPFGEGEEIKRRAEFVEVLPHEGDMVIKDTKGEYSDKITYLGEYFRLKSPQEGYIAKAYVEYYKDGKMIDEKLIRKETYKPQKGIVMEGVERLGEGMSIPENEVRIIPPQSKSKLSKDAIDNKLGKQNTSNFNP